LRKKRFRWSALPSYGNRNSGLLSEYQ